MASEKSGTEMIDRSKTVPEPQERKDALAATYYARDEPIVPVRREFSSLFTLFAFFVSSIVTYEKLLRADFPLWVLSAFFMSLIGIGTGFFGELLKPEGPSAIVLTALRAAINGLVTAAQLMTVLFLCFARWELGWTFLIAVVAAFFFFGMISTTFDPSTKLLVVYTIILFAILVVELGLLIGVRQKGEPKAVYDYHIAGVVVVMVAAALTKNQPLSHLVNTVAPVLFYLSLSKLVMPAPDAKMDWKHALLATGGALTGLITALLRTTFRQRVRFWLVNSLWSFVYGELFQKNVMPLASPPVHCKGSKIHYIKYYENNPLSYPVSILSANDLPENQKFPKIYKLLNVASKLIRFFDHYIPQATNSVAPSSKPRIDPRIPVEKLVPTIIDQYGTKTRFYTPRLLQQWNEFGQSITWLVLYGHCSMYLQRIDDDDFRHYPQLRDLRCTHKLDFNQLRKYSPKQFYHGYGGRGFFRYDGNSREKLRLEFVSDFRDVTDDTLLAVSSGTGSVVLTSVQSLVSAGNFLCVAGTHFVGIHCLMNIVSISLYNAFDIVESPPEFIHPFRAVMNLHFYNHALVQEKVTPHLLDKNAVFAQIWALEHASLCQFVNDHFQEMVYGNDVDIEEHERILSEDGVLPEHGQIAWKKEYRKIFREYAMAVTQIIWSDEEALRRDEPMRVFFDELNSAYRARRPDAPEDFPSRYQRFETREGIQRFIADSIFIVTVHHEIVGTKISSYGTNPLIVPGQIPVDLGPPTIDTFQSHLLITAATSRVQYPLLLAQNPDIFLRGVNPDIFNALAAAFERMKYTLTTLQMQWTLTEEDLSINAEFGRVVPMELETNAGY